jgi:hypothetical protein
MRNCNAFARPIPPALHHLLGLVLLLVVQLAIAPIAPIVPMARAQTAASPQVAEKMPHLGAHTFVPNTHARDPFIKTFVRNTISAGKAINVTIPLAVIDSNTVVGLSGDIIVFALEFEYQQAIKSWLAARGRLEIFGRVGTGVQSLLSQGITASTSFELGWLIKLHRSERTMLSASLDLSNSSNTLINVQNFIEDIIDPIPGQPASLTHNVPAVWGGGGLRFAWGISSLFGGTIDGRLGYGESIARDEGSDWRYDIGLALDADLRVKTSVPIGLVLGYSMRSLSADGINTADTMHEALLRIAYNGRDDFLISLDISWGIVPTLGVDDSVDFISSGINLRYYF